jgi:hypothetical protein
MIEWLLRPEHWMLLFASCPTAALMWAITSYPDSKGEKIFNRIVGVYTIVSFIVLFILNLFL